jgi:tRNA G18 (ribose-2'-O)-methylase SpoU
MFGIGIVNVKHDVNVGALLRAAYNFGAAFVFTIGRRYRKMATDTMNAAGTLPLFHCATVSNLATITPYSWPRVAVELSDGAIDIRRYTHLKRCVYILGPEDGDIPAAIRAACHTTIVIPTRQCLNVGVAAAVVMYDRLISMTVP